MALTGWTYQGKITIPSSTYGMSGDQTDFTHLVHISPSFTAFWAAVKSDGTDVRFTSSDETTLLKFEIESFDSTGDDAYYHVKIPTLGYAADTIIYIYCGNAGASSGEDRVNAWDSSYVDVLHFNQDSSIGAFTGSISGLTGTNNGSTDAAGEIDRGRGIDCTVPTDIVFADNDQWSFGNGTTDTPMTIEVWVKMTDATRFRLLTKGNTTTGSDWEYYWLMDATDALVFRACDKSSGTRQETTTSTFTADEGSWIQLIVTKTSGTTIALHRNATALASTPTSSGTYTAMENLAAQLDIGSYFSTADTTGSGVIDEMTFSNVVRSADWMKARYQSGLGTGLTFETVDHLVVVTDTVAMSEAVSVTQYHAITDGIALSEGILLNGATYIFVTDGIALAETAFQSYKEVLLTDGINMVEVAGSVNQNSLYFAVTGFPSGQTVEYRIKTQNKVIIQDWTAVGVDEDEEIPGYSTYSITNIILENGFQGKVSWRINGTTYYAVEILNYFESFVFGQITVGDIEASTVLAKEATVAGKLDAAAYVDHTTAISTLQTDITSLVAYALAMSKWKNNRMVRTSVAGTLETWILYDDDNTTPLLTWLHDTSAKVRTKAT